MKWRPRASLSLNLSFSRPWTFPESVTPTKRVPPWEFMKAARVFMFACSILWSMSEVWMFILRVDLNSSFEPSPFEIRLMISFDDSSRVFLTPKIFGYLFICFITNSETTFILPSLMKEYPASETSKAPNMFTTRSCIVSMADSWRVVFMKVSSANSMTSQTVPIAKENEKVRNAIMKGLAVIFLSLYRT